jgi:hypothetical protein
MSGLWAIDIGSSAMCWEEMSESTGQAQGLAFVRSANNQYHIGLGLVYLVFFIQLAWMLYLILNTKDINRWKEKKSL